MLDGDGSLLAAIRLVSAVLADLKIHPDMIAEWAWGRRELPPDHPIFTALAVLVQYHDKGVAEVRKVTDLHRA